MNDDSFIAKESEKYSQYFPQGIRVRSGNEVLLDLFSEINESADGITITGLLQTTLVFSKDSFPEFIKLLQDINLGMQNNEQKIESEV